MNKSKIIIGLIGPKTSGKSTVANILSEFYPIQEVALADKLKNTICTVFNLSREQLDSQNLKEVIFKEPREITPQIITNVLKAFNIDSNSYKDKTTTETYLQYFKPLLGMKLRSPRETAQIIGSELLRSIDKDIHCKSIAINDNTFTVVSDVRFLNEYVFFDNIRDATFIPLYIKRSSAENKVTEESHISERDFLSFRDKCFKVDNDGSLKDTELQVKQIVDKVLYGGK